MSTTKTEYDVDICVIGAGSAGLSMTAGAAMLDRNVLLFEGAEMGGDCQSTRWHHKSGGRDINSNEGKEN